MMRCVLPGELNRLTIVVPDAKPLLALSRQSALDALLALRRTELWVSDIAEAGNVMDVMEPMEVREADRELWHRAADWLGRHRTRFHLFATEAGRRRADRMAADDLARELWRRAGCPPDLRPLLVDHRPDECENALLSVQLARQILDIEGRAVVLADSHNLITAMHLIRPCPATASRVWAMSSGAFLRWSGDDFAGLS
jgi:hypothetical protein